MKISLAQLDPHLGAFDANLRKIQEKYKRACSERARFLLTSEMVVSGYPLYDWIERPELLRKTEEVLEFLTRLTQNQSTALVVGHIWVNPSSQGRAFQNGVSVLEGGRVVFRQAKTLLPVYDVFDESRYFEPAEKIELWNCDGCPIALAICEDLWGAAPKAGRLLYRDHPVETYQRLGAKLVVSLSASPYEWVKSAERERLHQEVVQKLKVPLIYVNQVGAYDEILFDGGSFVLDAEGARAGGLPFFAPAEGSVVFDPLSNRLSDLSLSASQDSDWEILMRGLVLGIREYFSQTGFKKAVLGLSGGLDSAVVAALAVLALGAENVLAVAMPSQYSSSHSLEDAEILARKLGIRIEVRPIKFAFATLSREFSELRGTLNAVALENLQSRLRGMLLMTLSNHDSSLVLTTGNKSEIAMGYCTLYGDMNGALCPLGDLYKTQVYQLAQHLNRTRGDLIPDRILTKAPSAELRPHQKDQDTLPPYDVLDQFLCGYLEQNESVSVLEQQFKNVLPDQGQGSVRDLVRRIQQNEYKRRQGAPILKVSQKAFGVGRRVPLAKAFVEA